MPFSRIQKQRGLKWAKAQAELAARAPDEKLKADAYRVANNARMEYGYSWSDKKDEVVRCVRLGASTKDDLLRETPFNKQEIVVLLTELVGDNILRVVHAQLNHVGPRVSQYFLVDT